MGNSAAMIERHYSKLMARWQWRGWLEVGGLEQRSESAGSQRQALWSLRLRKSPIRICKLRERRVKEYRCVPFFAY